MKRNKKPKDERINTTQFSWKEYLIILAVILCLTGTQSLILNEYVAFSEVPIDFIVEYMTSIFVGTLHWWLTSETDMSSNHLARLVIKLVGNGHLTVLGIEIER